MDLIIPDHPVAPASTRPQRIAIGALSLAVVALGLYTLWNFLSALVWAGIFCIALGPLYERAAARFGTGKHNVLLPAAFTLAVALVFILPLGAIGLEVAQEAHTASDWARGVERNGIPEPDLLHRLPFGQAQVDDWWKENLADPGGARDLVQRVSRGRVSDMSREIGRQVVRRLTLFTFTLLILFFLFKERQRLAEQFRIASGRAFGSDGARIGRQIIASVHGTVDGLVLVGIGEGFVLGIVYGIAGVPHATIFGVLTAVAAMIPFAAPVIFGLAALLLIAQGSLAWGIAVICIGFAITLSADHFVRPVLIGGATELPFIWVLLGILGGVEEWGLLGLFLGPAIMAVLIMLWREWACGKRGVAA